MATPTTLPAAFTVGQVLTSTQMNDLRGAFRILQVVTASKSDTFTMASTTFADVTGLSVSITPQATTSKIFVMVSLTGTGATGATTLYARLMRDSTAIAVGDAAGSRTRASVTTNDADTQKSLVVMVLDSPATVASTTYKIQVRTQSAGPSVFINRGSIDTDFDFYARTFSSITVFEVSA
jgi:hypothetical protein